MKLYTEQDRLIQMHPALDIVNGVVYVTVRARDEKGRSLNAIITSEQEVYDYEEWTLEQKKRGLEPYTDVNLEYGSRWSHKGITTFLQQ
ncbi:hypothetical protein KSC_081870 [Ktedonobacter sp. SOSP1-52]|nr:hypothetical protein KSC_081870 [Ktedonobacter sp. SOSP1-52]